MRSFAFPLFRWSTFAVCKSPIFRLRAAEFPAASQIAFELEWTLSGPRAAGRASQDALCPKTKHWVLNKNKNEISNKWEKLGPRWAWAFSPPWGKRASVARRGKDSAEKKPVVENRSLLWQWGKEQDNIVSQRNRDARIFAAAGAPAGSNRGHLAASLRG